jgi:hypothetical protein
LYRFTDTQVAQLQNFSQTRFSGIAVLLRSLLKYRTPLNDAVNSPHYIQRVLKTCKRKKQQREWEETRDEELQLLLEAEEQIEADPNKNEAGLWNDKPLPAELIGTKKFARIFQNVNSKRFWEATQVSSQSVLSVCGSKLSEDIHCDVMSTRSYIE